MKASIDIKKRLFIGDYSVYKLFYEEYYYNNNNLRIIYITEKDIKKIFFQNDLLVILKKNSTQKDLDNIVPLLKNNTNLILVLMNNKKNLELKDTNINYISSFKKNNYENYLQAFLNIDINAEYRFDNILNCIKKEKDISLSLIIKYQDMSDFVFLLITFINLAIIGLKNFTIYYNAFVNKISLYKDFHPYFIFNIAKTLYENNITLDHLYNLLKELDF